MVVAPKQGKAPKARKRKRRRARRGTQSQPSASAVVRPTALSLPDKEVCGCERKQKRKGSVSPDKTSPRPAPSQKRILPLGPTWILLLFIADHQIPGRRVCTDSLPRVLLSRLARPSFFFVGDTHTGTPNREKKGRRVCPRIPCENRLDWVPRSPRRALWYPLQEILDGKPLQPSGYPHGNMSKQPSDMIVAKSSYVRSRVLACRISASSWPG
jgi:hypothetical protein